MNGYVNLRSDYMKNIHDLYLTSESPTNIPGIYEYFNKIAHTNKLCVSRFKVASADGQIFDINTTVTIFEQNDYYGVLFYSFTGLVSVIISPNDDIYKTGG